MFDYSYYAIMAGEGGFFGGEEFGGAHEVGGGLGFDAGIFAVGGEGDDLENRLCGLKFGRSRQFFLQGATSGVIDVLGA